MALKIHHLRPVPDTNTAETHVGRGEASKSRTTGRGIKGTGAHKNVPTNFGSGQMPMHMWIPELKGFKNPLRVEYQVVNVGRLAESFPRGGAVTVKDLAEAGAVRDGALVKMLGDGDTNITLGVTADVFSSSAKEKLVATGGSAVKT